ncbi:MAG TPA: autotransporter domain-containing protein [Arenibaculum sp.]|nr:autotransporter domain-containing protein [Arenibaculum sp.]
MRTLRTGPSHAGLMAAVLAAASMGIAATPAPAQDFERLVVFGNSLSDDGNLYRATRLNPGGPIPRSPPYYEGRFSNGPVWVERLVPLAGGPGAALENNAFGGAETGLRLDPPGISAQVLGWLGTGNRPRDGDLAVVWGGANDYRADPLTPEPAALVDRTVGNLGLSIERLVLGGARDILVPNLPDLGATPAARMADAVQPGVAERLSTLSRLHDERLGRTLDDLRARHPGIRITRLDTAALFRDALANPAVYGFTNVTTPCLSDAAPGVGQPTGACATPEETAGTLFFDPLHPSAAGHDVLARYAAAALDGPPAAAMAASVPQALGLGSAAAHRRAVTSRLSALRASAAGFAPAVAAAPRYASAGPLPAGPDLPAARDAARDAAERPFGIFAYAEHDWGDRDAITGRAGFDYRTSLVAAGLDWRLSDLLRLGLAAGYGWGRSEIDAGLGSAELDGFQLGVYAGLGTGLGTGLDAGSGAGGWYVDLDAGVSFDAYDIERRTGFAPRPTARAETDGRTWWAGATAGYEAAAGAVRAGPFAGLRYARTDIDGYTESEAGPLSLTVGDQDAQSLLGTLGVRAATRIERAGWTVEPSVRAAWEHEFRDDERRVTASLAGSPATAVSGPGDRDWFTLGAGVAVGSPGGPALAVEYEGTLGRSDGSDHAVRAKATLPL